MKKTRSDDSVRKLKTSAPQPPATDTIHQQNPEEARPACPLIPAKKPGEARPFDCGATVSQKSFPIVGIGASAGGLKALELFFAGMPDTHPKMAFIVVQHLAPDHKSILTELIGRHTRMKVVEVEDGMLVRPDCAYIIPPNKDMAIINRTLQLLEPAAPRGQRLPIDFFFRSLADDCKERAVAIVLSGTGSDGASGIQTIKALGGIVMVQNPDSADYDGMPRSAIATELVDYILLPQEMPKQLLAHSASIYQTNPSIEPGQSIQITLNKIYTILRNQTGHDFSHYKPSTIRRRIHRRMAVHQISTMDGYIKYLLESTTEAQALFRDLLIGVTHFFRDADAFKALEESLPKIFQNKPADTTIRVWVPGCSTGEEAYSIAILMHEYQETIKQNYLVQIFATDMDAQAITTARLGVFPPSITTDISPERLGRFFTQESNAYRIHKYLRDMVIFSEHDIIKDPPFSRLDLISCRNLLIYLDSDLQKAIFPLFHYALKPSGLIFLGSSESIGNAINLFEALDRKNKLYQRKDNTISIKQKLTEHFIPTISHNTATAPSKERKPHTNPKSSLRELTEQALLKELTPVAALINGQGDIFYLHGRSGLYLEPAPGEAGVNNILHMSREGLRCELTIALRKASTSNVKVYRPGLNIRTNGHFTQADLTVCPLHLNPTEVPLYLVILQEVPAISATQHTPAEPKDSSPDMDAYITALKQELRAKEDYLEAANEAMENSNEELKSYNEEMQSMNEELQSTNEELETSKEELQSVNEELTTVNAELQAKVADLSRLNNDMNNLLAGTGIGTVFVDMQLHILRFTPAASSIINLIPGDVGRPVGHLASNLKGYNNLLMDVRSVLDTLVPRVADVQTTEGRWYTMRIQPYRTLENAIEGAVITFAERCNKKD